MSVKILTKADHIMELDIGRQFGYIYRDIKTVQRLILKVKEYFDAKEE